VDPETRERADLRLEAELRETGANDPRGAYRALLRELRERDEAAYAIAVRDFQESVLEPIARGEEGAVRIWLEFGIRLAARLHPGRSVVVDPAGRARPIESLSADSGGNPPEGLVLHLPDDRRVRAVPVGLPPRISPAQQATLDVLAFGRVKMGAS